MPKIKKIAVLDMDGCMATIQSKNKYLLSDPLIQIMQQVQYDGFYGFTHRGIANNAHNVEKFIVKRNSKGVMVDGIQLLQECQKGGKWEGHYEQLQYLTRYADLELSELFTHNTVNNLSKLTGVPLITVSTPDDELNPGRCGAAYEQVIKPWEMLAVEKAKERFAQQQGKQFRGNPQINAYMQTFKDYGFQQFIFEQAREQNINCFEGANTYNEATKQPQLLEVARHAARLYPYNIIELEVRDDRLELLADLAQISPELLPINVKVSFYEHISFSADANVAKHSIEYPGENNKVPTVLCHPKQLEWVQRADSMTRIVAESPGYNRHLSQLLISNHELAGPAFRHAQRDVKALAARLEPKVSLLHVLQMKH